MRDKITMWSVIGLFAACWASPFVLALFGVEMWPLNPSKVHIIHPDGTQEHRPLTPDEEEQLRPMTVEEFKKFQDELRKEMEARKVECPHWDDGHWEVVKRWQNYPFVRWGWTWDGRKDEPTLYMEARENNPPAKPPKWLPPVNDDFAPGTKNNL